ncbi:MAG: RNA polymerase sigma factor [Planctomycetota bacterium]
MQPDSVLVDRVRRGETSAYEQLVVRYRRAAMLVALQVLPDHHSAEDVVQDSFVTAFEQLDSLRDGSRFAAWLTRIVRRRAFRAARERRPTMPVDSISQPTTLPADSERDGCEKLIEWINRLPKHERLVVTLHHLDGHPVGEIARITGRPVGTVTKQLSRAMHRLRRWAGVREPSP